MHKPGFEFCNLNSLHQSRRVPALSLVFAAEMVKAFLTSAEPECGMRRLDSLRYIDHQVINIPTAAQRFGCKRGSLNICFATCVQRRRGRQSTK